MYPQSIREEMEALHGFETSPDGRRWPKPELVKLEAGDAVLVMHACPHGGSHVAGPDPRIQCYYRITTEERAADRHAGLCDHWADWHGSENTSVSPTTTYLRGMPLTWFFRLPSQ